MVRSAISHLFLDLSSCWHCPSCVVPSLGLGWVQTHRADRTRSSRLRPRLSHPRERRTITCIEIMMQSYELAVADSPVRSRRANGATQTFRRPSTTAMSNSPHQRDGSASQPRTSTESTGVYVPPHVNNANRNGASSDYRYSRDQLIHLYKGREESENNPQVLSELYAGGWEPNNSNGVSGASWGRRDEQRDSHGADLCWDREGHMAPMGLHDMTDEERDVSISPS
jgi:hypothetical protein